MTKDAKERQLSEVILTFDADNICTGPDYLAGLSMDQIAEMSPEEMAKRKKDPE